MHIKPYTHEGGGYKTNRDDEGREDVGKLDPGAPLVGMRHEAATAENSVELPQEIRNRTTI